MTPPSKRSGFPSLHFLLLLALMLFLGLALAPKTFEFRAWPEPARSVAIEEVVDRPVPAATEIEVASVRERDREKAPERDSTADRGSSERRSGETAEVREDRARPDRGGRERKRDAEAPGPVEVVEEEPPAPDAPPVAEPAADQPAQLAEVPSTDPFLRPEADEHVPPAPAVPSFEADRETEGELDVRSLLGHRDCDHRGRGRGHRRHGG